ncbi:hypothetical protein E0L36_19395 [Streptomyces sp. AJS327]|nr:hypothetical protein [Streptomyces sp. AJS327]
MAVSHHPAGHPGRRPGGPPPAPPPPRARPETAPPPTTTGRTAGDDRSAGTRRTGGCQCHTGRETTRAFPPGSPVGQQT